MSSEALTFTDSARVPAAWSNPVEQRFGLVVEVGRRGDDILYHLWHDKFPEEFPDQLHDAVEKVMGCPERFQAVYTPEVMALWDPRSNELHPGDREHIQRLAVRAPVRQMTSWAMRAVGFGPVKAAHSKLTNELLEAIESIFVTAKKVGASPPPPTTATT